MVVQEETDFGQFHFGHPDLTNFGQFNFGQSIFGHLGFGPANPEWCGAQNFAFLFRSAAPIFALFASLWVSSRGILVVFEAPEPSNVRVWSPRAQTGTFEGPGLRKHHQYSTGRHPERDKKSENGARDGQKSKILGGQAKGGPAQRGPAQGGPPTHNTHIPTHTNTQQQHTTTTHKNGMAKNGMAKIGLAQIGLNR